MTAPVLRPLSLGELLDTSFAVYRTLFAQLLLVAVLTNGLPNVLGVYVEFAGGIQENLLFWLGTLLFSMVLGAIGVAATTFIVSDHYLGDSLTAGAAFGRAAPHVISLVLLSIVASFLIGLGLLLLVIPGLIAMCGLAVAPASLVLERLPNATAGLSRSWELTKGFRWKVLGTLIVVAILMIVPSVAIGVVATIFGAAGGAPIEVMGSIVVVVLGVLISPFYYVALTVLYYDLRVRKEGFDLEVLAGALG